MELREHNFIHAYVREGLVEAMGCTVEVDGTADRGTMS